MAAKKKASEKVADGSAIMKKALEMVKAGNSLKAVQLLERDAPEACKAKSAQQIVFAMQKA